jgi:hypothetical protein
MITLHRIEELKSLLARDPNEFAHDNLARRDMSTALEALINLNQGDFETDINRALTLASKLPDSTTPAVLYQNALVCYAHLTNFRLQCLSLLGGTK